jgi:hypothetical protein
LLTGCSSTVSGQAVGVAWLQTTCLQRANSQFNTRKCPWITYLCLCVRLTIVTNLVFQSPAPTNTCLEPVSVPKYQWNGRWLRTKSVTISVPFTIVTSRLAAAKATLHVNVASAAGDVIAEDSF